MHKRNREIHGVWSREAAARSNRATYAAAPKGEQAERYRMFFKKALRGRKGAKVLILGATPELRSIALSLGCETLAVDFAYEIIARMHSLIKRPDDPRNMILRADWLSLVDYLKPHTFDIVAGDSATSQLTIPQQRKLYRDIHTLLKQRGVFVARIDDCNPDAPKRDARELVREYLAGKMSSVSHMIATMLYSNVTKHMYNPKTGLLQSYKFWDYMEQFYKEGLIPKRQAELFRKGRQNMTHIVPPEKLVAQMTDPYFKRIDMPQHDRTWPTQYWIAKS